MRMVVGVGFPIPPGNGLRGAPPTYLAKRCASGINVGGKIGLVILVILQQGINFNLLIPCLFPSSDSILLLNSAPPDAGDQFGGLSDSLHQ